MARDKQLGADLGYSSGEQKLRSSDIAPSPTFPERAPTIYERKIAPARVGNRGPLRFEEGIATDTDVPDDFQLGISQGYVTPPGRPNHNMNVWEKPADQTMRERAHMGSAAWVEAPTFLGEFAHGSFNDNAALTYEQVDRGAGLGRRWERRNPARIDG